MQINQRAAWFTRNVRQKIKEKVCARRIINYWCDYARPMTKNEGKAILYSRDDNGMAETA